MAKAMVIKMSACDAINMKLQDPVVFLDHEEKLAQAEQLAKQLGAPLITRREELPATGVCLCVKKEGLMLEGEGQTMFCDLIRMLPRLKQSNLRGELLVKAAKLRKKELPLRAVDATAGLGEDALLLAAAGFQITLYERNPVIGALLEDALLRAACLPELSETVGRMHLVKEDSIKAMPLSECPPSVIYLDPMFPGKIKTALTKKKFQLLHQLELPCDEEEGLLQAAIAAKPYKIVIKRPLKGGYLGGRKPDYALVGKAIRYDCLVFPENEPGLI